MAQALGPGYLAGSYLAVAPLYVLNLSNADLPFFRISFLPLFHRAGCPKRGHFVRRVVMEILN